MRRREVLAAISGISALSQTAVARSASKPSRIALIHSGIPAADLNRERRAILGSTLSPRAAEIGLHRG